MRAYAIGPTKEVAVIVQWCAKGVGLANDDEAKMVLASKQGLLCNWWRDVGTISPDLVRTKLTDANLDRHVNHFTAPEPLSGRPFREVTPFISMSAGTIERDSVAKTNYVHRARKTALWFGSNFGANRTAYLFIAWTLTGPRSAVEVESVAEEVRDLNSYRRYSSFQTEGEITVKINLPHNQIHSCERWDLTRSSGTPVLRRSWIEPNRDFTPPELLTNIRELI